MAEGPGEAEAVGVGGGRGEGGDGAREPAGVEDGGPLDGGERAWPVDALDDEERGVVAGEQADRVEQEGPLGEVEAALVEGLDERGEDRGAGAPHEFGDEVRADQVRREAVEAERLQVPGAGDRAEHGGLDGGGPGVPGLDVAGEAGGVDPVGLAGEQDGGGDELEDGVAGLARGLDGAAVLLVLGGGEEAAQERQGPLRVGPDDGPLEAGEGPGGDGGQGVRGPGAGGGPARVEGEVLHGGGHGEREAVVGGEGRVQLPVGGGVLAAGLEERAAVVVVEAEDAEDGRRAEGARVAVEVGQPGAARGRVAVGVFEGRDEVVAALVADHRGLLRRLGVRLDRFAPSVPAPGQQPTRPLGRKDQSIFLRCNGFGHFGPSRGAVGSPRS
nr:hypothetical protein GCM10025732_46890 [Glycomyces mayteni]